MIGRLSVLLLFIGAIAQAAVPPDAPIIIEPSVDGEILNAADIHMATAPFHDDDGDSHRCSDFEIHQGDEPVWIASCVTGPEKVHIHLGNGVFQGSRTHLDDDTDYSLHVRFRDGSDDPATEWSAWTVRLFHTAPALPAKPLAIRQIAAVPRPRWVTTDGEEIIPPDGAHLRLEFVDGAILLDILRIAGAVDVDVAHSTLSSPSRHSRGSRVRSRPVVSSPE